MAKKKTQSRLSLFGQMLLSYCVCLIMVAAFVGSTIYARVFRDYRREVEELSAGVMVQYAEILQTRVIDPAEGCALDFMLGRTSDITVQKVLSSGRLPLHIAYTYNADFDTALKRYIPLVSDIRVYNARANMFLSKTVGLHTSTITPSPTPIPTAGWTACGRSPAAGCPRSRPNIPACRAGSCATPSAIR